MGAPPGAARHLPIAMGKALGGRLNAAPTRGGKGQSGSRYPYSLLPVPSSSGASSSNFATTSSITFTAPRSSSSGSLPRS